MAIEKIEVYTMECDSCSKLFEDGDFSIFADKEIMTELSEEEGWGHIAGLSYCDKCCNEVGALKQS